MSRGDEGQVLYREIEKNAYLKRIPNENTSKLLPLAHKKPPLKPMWTLFCVHNGRTPYLEQYPEPESPSTRAHKPAWRACLRAARHVTASVRPHAGDQYDFLVDTDNGPVRMLAPDWDTMQDWVSSLRNKLHELKILPKGENVYCAPPAAPPAPPRAAARDPTSPLPPTPPTPPDRVPGIELTSPLARLPTTEDLAPSQPETPQPDPPEVQNIDISNWEEESGPSTSQLHTEPKKSVAKICGQNICLDDSILKRNLDTTDSEEEFFAEIDRLNSSVENVNVDSERAVDCDYKQRVQVNDDEEVTALDQQSDRPTNITVIQVSNKPPHTAIPVMGSEQVFNFDFKQHLPVNDNQTDSFINIVNTEETNITTENGYGTVFTKEDDYGHISLTTTVKLTGDVKDKDSEGIYERLCMASTSNENKSPLMSKKIDRLKNGEKVRKSSLPNLDISTESTYEYLFPNNNKNIITLNTESQSLLQPLNSMNGTYNSEERNTSLTNGRLTSVVTSNSSAVNNSDRTVHLNLCSSVSVDISAPVVRPNVERSLSQNAYDGSPRREGQDCRPKKELKCKQESDSRVHPFIRGLTELSLLSRLRGLGQRNDERKACDRPCPAAAPAPPPPRGRSAIRADPARRRSTSLNNGPAPPPPVGSPGSAPAPALVPLRARQAASLRAEQRRGAALATTVLRAHPPLVVDYNRQVWVSWWGGGGCGARCGGRAGDRLAAVRRVPPRDAAHARQLLACQHTPHVDVLFHRVPLAQIYVINKRDKETIGIKLDSECNITQVLSGSPAALAGLPPAAGGGGAGGGGGGPAWAVTEVNNRPINLLKGGEEEMNRMSVHGTEVSVLVQPAALVKKIRHSLKANKALVQGR